MPSTDEASPITIQIEPMPSSTPTSGQLSADALDRALLATVQILVPPDNGQDSSSGSGSILTSQGHILTNFHVVGNPDTGQLFNNSTQINIATSGDLRESVEVRYLGQVLEYDLKLDLALIKITATKNGSPLPENLNLITFPIGDSESVRIGQELSIIGFPGLGGNSVTFTKGTVSGFLTNEGWVKTDAEINFGNSGGAAINQAGELVGVPSAAAGETVELPGKIGLVRPLKLAQPLIDRAFREAGE
ncbi:MAG: S1C family serine protease [Ardenticatenaceae bacterium]